MTRVHALPHQDSPICGGTLNTSVPFKKFTCRTFKSLGICVRAGIVERINLVRNRSSCIYIPAGRAYELPSHRDTFGLLITREFSRTNRIDEPEKQMPQNACLEIIISRLDVRNLCQIVDRAKNERRGGLRWLLITNNRKVQLKSQQKFSRSISSPTSSEIE